MTNEMTPEQRRTGRALAQLQKRIQKMHALRDKMNAGLARETARDLLLMLAPFAPHITEELWSRLFAAGSVHQQKWPSYDEEALKVIQKGVKTRRETAKLYEDKGLADKAAPETAEADFLETFLPAAASDEDYAKAVADAVAEVNPAGPKDMGRVVKAARAALAGKTIDGGKLAGLVKAELNK